ncbi:ATP-binding protein [Ochrobactrum pseudogrignonense]|uniref:ATP-binding protein n=1 Tax=Brucella pseudogrignonensis TaxID=419475 RepID=A0A7Y3WWZ7_9HYPH|nr:ATP-binding protein [Brucella pseudogrignonensis]NNV20683.1 ATP-binding protein [Brucella pseudogrignonensis]
MSQHNQIVNEASTAPIKNVALCLALARSLQNRHPSQPNLGVFAGFSGYGKSKAAVFAQGGTNAVLIEVSDTWTKKTLLQEILMELGHPQAKGTLADLEKEIIGTLARDPHRPLIIDEADKLVDKNMFEMMRMIAKKANIPVMLIGEELLPKKLERIDRIRDLVLEWKYAQKCDLDDTKSLARAYYPSISISDDLLEHVKEEAKGRARQICNSLHAIANAANVAGLSQIGLKDYRSQNGYFASDKVPVRRDQEAA